MTWRFALDAGVQLGRVTHVQTVTALASMNSMRQIPYRIDMLLNSDS